MPELWRFLFESQPLFPTQTLTNAFLFNFALSIFVNSQSNFISFSTKGFFLFSLNNFAFPIVLFDRIISFSSSCFQIFVKALYPTLVLWLLQSCCSQRTERKIWRGHAVYLSPVLKKLFVSITPFLK